MASSDHGEQDATGTIRWSGRIVRRRSLGRCLAFCDIRLSTNEVVKTAFRGNLYKGTNFPVKKSALPIGAEIEMTCLIRESITTSNDTVWDVTAFRLLTDPRTLAIEASTTETGGISCTNYLRSRREAYDQVSTPEIRNLSPKTALDDQTDIHSVSKDKHEYSVGSYKVFAAWIADTLLRNDGTDRVLDVAGGKGHLSVQLGRQGIPCTVIDPVQRRPPKGLKKLTERPEFVARHFERNHVSLELASAHTCLVGLHPDQPTEYILDIALEQKRSVAVVPCCVFPDFFNCRVLKGKLVRNYDEFLEYLLAKDPRLQRTRLPFNGKNECIYLRC